MIVSEPRKGIRAPMTPPYPHKLPVNIVCKSHNFFTNPIIANNQKHNNETQNTNIDFFSCSISCLYIGILISTPIMEEHFGFA